MIPTLIISKDRPSQLDLLLRSLEKNAKDLFDITIIYKASDELYNHGYGLLKKIYPNITYIWEEDCNKQFYEWLNSIEHPLVNFFTDDCIFYRENKVWEDDLLKLFSMQNIWTFTYRLGYNIEIQDYTIQNTTDRPNIFVEKYNSLIYDYKRVRFDHSFGWPVGLDGYVWRTGDLKNLLEGKPFNNFCRLEGLMVEQYKQKQPLGCMMGCPFKSNIFVQQINVVHGLPHNTINKFNVSTEELNNKFLNGEIVALNSMDFTGVNCTHGEIEWKYL